MNIQLHDIKDIVNKSKQGGGNYSPLEVALAEKAWTYYCTIARNADEIAKLKDVLYSVYNAIMRNGELAECLNEKRKKDLAGNSKAAFARAVELDNELKKLG